MRSFFTGVPNIEALHYSSSVHAALIIVCFVIGAYILLKGKVSRKFEVIASVTMIVQQITLYSWYMIGGFDRISEGLPFYHCRIAIILLAAGVLFKNDIVMKLGAYWGIVGAPISILVVGGDPFAFPHLTQISYWVGHGLLLWLSIYVLWVKKVGITFKELKTLLIFTNGYYAIMLVFNLLTESNYGYITHTPIGIERHFPVVVFVILMVLFANAVMISLYFIIKKIHTFRLERSNSSDY